MEQEPENLTISLQPVIEEFVCPICMELIKDCTITACGHNFCKTCITESINRKHNCPICNTVIIKTQLFPNKHFDRLCAIILEEKTKASKIYFESLIVGKSATASQSGAKEAAKLSPIEELFRDHLKLSLASYDQYYSKLKQKSDVAKKAIEAEYTEKMMVESKKISNKNLRLSQDERIKKLQKECNTKVKENDEAFSRSTELLLKSYEEFLKQITPPPQYLPVTVDILILDKKIKIQNVVIKSMDTVKDLKKIVETNIEKSGDSVSSWKKENVFAIVANATDKQGTVIANDDVPILQYKIENGSSIQVLGKIVCKSDAPKQCFKSLFVADKNDTCDYFSCGQCQLNWLCKSCSEVCHKGHKNITATMLNHKATWACCYCAKKDRSACHLIGK